MPSATSSRRTTVGAPLRDTYPSNPSAVRPDVLYFGVGTAHTTVLPVAPSFTESVARLASRLDQLLWSDNRQLDTDAGPLPISRGGRAHYSFNLRMPDGSDLYLPSVKAAPHFPPVFRISTQAMVAVDLSGLHAYVRHVESLVGLDSTASSIRPNRLDVTLDLLFPPGAGPTKLRDSERVVSRAGSSEHDNAEIVSASSQTRRDRWSGLSVNSRAVNFRLYDKLREIGQAGSTLKSEYWHKVWEQNGHKIDPSRETVWRFEHQIKRPMLDRFQVNSVEDFSDQFGDVMRHLTGSGLDSFSPSAFNGVWMRVAEVSSKNHRPLLPWWASYVDTIGTLGLPASGVRPAVRAHLPDRSVLVRQIRGALSSLAALDSTVTGDSPSLDCVLDRLLRLEPGFPSEFDGDVSVKTARFQQSVAWEQQVRALTSPPVALERGAAA